MIINIRIIYCNNEKNMSIDAEIIFILYFSFNPFMLIDSIYYNSIYHILSINPTVRVEVGKIFCRRGIGNLQFYRTPQWMAIVAYWSLLHLCALAVHTFTTTPFTTKVKKLDDRRWDCFHVMYFLQTHARDWLLWMSYTLCYWWLIWPIQNDAKKLKNDWYPGI